MFTSCVSPCRTLVLLTFWEAQPCFSWKGKRSCDFSYSGSTNVLLVEAHLFFSFWGSTVVLHARKRHPKKILQENLEKIRHNPKIKSIELSPKITASDVRHKAANEKENTTAVRKRRMSNETTKATKTIKPTTQAETRGHRASSRERTSKSDVQTTQTNIVRTQLGNATDKCCRTIRPRGTSHRTPTRTSRITSPTIPSRNPPPLPSPDAPGPTNAEKWPSPGLRLAQTKHPPGHPFMGQSQWPGSVKCRDTTNRVRYTPCTGPSKK